MALIQKTGLIQIRVEPDLIEKMQQMSDYHRVSVSAMIRQWMHYETSRFLAARERDRIKAAKEAAEAPPAPPVAVPPPETFELEKSPPKRSTVPTAMKNREQRRAEAAEAKAWEKREKAEAKKKARSL